MPTLSRWFSFLLALLAASAQAAFDPAKVSVESAAVAAQFPEPDVAYATPGFAPGRTDFTAHGEIMAFIDALQARTNGFAVRIAGRSQEGRAIPVLVFTQPRLES